MLVVTPFAVLQLAFIDIFVQALRKMGAFTKRRRHPRAAHNQEVEEESEDKVSLQLVHLHDQVT